MSLVYLYRCVGAMHDLVVPLSGASGLSLCSNNRNVTGTDNVSIVPRSGGALRFATPPPSARLPGASRRRLSAQRRVALFSWGGGVRKSDRSLRGPPARVRGCRAPAIPPSWRVASAKPSPPVAALLVLHRVPRGGASTMTALSSQGVQNLNTRRGARGVLNWKQAVMMRSCCSTQGRLYGYKT